MTPGKLIGDMVDVFDAISRDTGCESAPRVVVTGVAII